ncbi:DJ-1/PfpI family protein [Lignipirellula cremea]|nr:DJ-1/PfpI family protein [Lignipirellula cremea]
MTKRGAGLLASLLLPVVLSAPLSAAEEGWIDLAAKADPAQAAAGEWRKVDGEWTTSAVAAARLQLPYTPQGEYDFRVQFTRTSGQHSIALIFPHGTGQATFELDAWGQHLAGLQRIAGEDLRQNGTQTEGCTLENGKTYTAVVEVRHDHVRALLDGKVLATHRSDGSDLSMLPLWRIENTHALGIGSYAAAATFHRIEVRPLGNATQLAAASSNSTPSSSTPMPRPSTTASRPVRPSAPTTTTPAGRGASPGGGKGSVLLVIANTDFFYREYAEPRQELERAGFRVVVGAGRKGACTPHNGSGQTGSGVVQADIALADVDAADYRAIMFSGGWGSSMYQFAFPGEYINRAYNGDRQTKAAANRLINEFIAQDKIVGALCHGVSVLAWARVDGKSPIAGKNVVAPTRDGPAGVYSPGAGRTQPSSRWNEEANGARLSPPQSIGNPRSSIDDVLVDGKIITGEDDIAARQFGVVLARMLSE